MATVLKLPQLSTSCSTASSYGPKNGTADKVVLEQFTVGLRILVVDDDISCLMILEQMLRRCKYHVTTCSKATDALNLLRAQKGCFDLILSDVHMPDMDGFKLLELVGIEMDLPVIMISADGRPSAVMRGIRHGACDYLIKPIREEELKNIWQHVVRKKWNENKESDNSGSLDDNDRLKRGNNDVEYASSVNEESGLLKAQKKRKDVKEEEDGELENDDPTTSKKPRVVWTVELHQQFVGAVNQLGIDKAVPKRILELMNVPGLTRENVASHLQKFRLYLKRLSGVAQQGGISNSFCGTMEQNPKLSPLARVNFQALAASGQIPPETLAALHAELLGRPTSNLVLPMMDHSTLLQASLQEQKCIPVDHVVAYGQPLAKCPSNISKQFPHTIISSEDALSGIGSCSSSSLVTMGSSSNVIGVGAQSGNMLAGILQNQQQQQRQMEQQQHKESILREPTCSINVQPSCLVAPSRSSSSQAGNGTASANQSSNLNRSSVTDYKFSVPQPNHSFGFRQMSDGDLKTTGVLNGYLGPGSISPSVSSCSANVETGEGENSGRPTYAARQLAGLVLDVNDIQGSYREKPSQVHNHEALRNLGFVGKRTSIPSRFAVDELESPVSNFSHGSICGENNAKRVKQEPNLDFIENANVVNPFTPSDLRNMFSK